MRSGCSRSVAGLRSRGVGFLFRSYGSRVQTITSNRRPSLLGGARVVACRAFIPSATREAVVGGVGWCGRGAPRDVRSRPNFRRPPLARASQDVAVDVDSAAPRACAQQLLLCLARRAPRGVGGALLRLAEVRRNDMTVRRVSLDNDTQSRSLAGCCGSLSRRGVAHASARRGRRGRARDRLSALRRVLLRGRARRADARAARRRRLWRVVRGRAARVARGGRR